MKLFLTEQNLPDKLKINLKRRIQKIAVMKFFGNVKIFISQLNSYKKKIC